MPRSTPKRRGHDIHASIKIILASLQKDGWHGNKIDPRRSAMLISLDAVFNSARHCLGDLPRSRKRRFAVALVLLICFWNVDHADAQRRVIKKVRFQRGQNIALLQGTLHPQTHHVYRMVAHAGQHMRARLLGRSSFYEAPDMVFWIQSRKYVANRDTLLLEGVDRRGETAWSGTLPVSGEYEIWVGNPEISDHPVKRPVHYKLQVEIP